MSSPIENTAQLVIGSVESVAPNEIKVLLDLDAPQTTALNTGFPRAFPRINSYVLVPNETGAVVGMISWLGIERSNFPKRTGLKDFDLIDLPFPLRKMIISPVGTLILTKNDEGNDFYNLQRGVAVFPSIGDQVLLPTEIQLRSIIESQGVNRRLHIGVSPLANNAVVSVDPDKLFGRHLAVLGNTGSGKSCSVAGLVRWSLESASKEKLINERTGSVNARFIILDPNGEYLKSFSDLTPTPRIFKVPPIASPDNPLTLPAWMWNSQEWSAFALAQPGTQRPLLLQGLRNMRSAATLTAPTERRLNLVFRTRFQQLQGYLGQGPAAYSGSFRSRMQMGDLLNSVFIESTDYLNNTTGNIRSRIESLARATRQLIDLRKWTSGNGFNDFNEVELRVIESELQALLDLIPLQESVNLRSEDAPIPFSLTDFPDHLDAIAANQTGGSAAQFISWLTMRIRMMLADRRLGPILNPDNALKFDEWLTDYIGGDNADNGQIAILDLSLVPADVLHMVIAVIARIIFEATQRYRRLMDNELPTVLILEEAHHFIRKGTNEDDGAVTANQMCRQVFERIAREGRKFGLGLLLSSQRPSELSPTVLAQCNTFLLHRIVNDRDQELVGKLIPDNLGGLLKDLPSLPSRQAILLGWATPVPVLVEIKELPEEHRPQSSDPKFWNVWTGEESRNIDWKRIADEWTS